jgi:hypothetical protein
MILMASQQATSPGFKTAGYSRKCLLVRQHMSFRGRGRQLARQNYDHGVSSPQKKLIVFDVLPRDNTFNQPYFINHIFPDLKTANQNGRHQKTGSTFWVHMDNSMCHNISKMTSKIKENHIFRMPHLPHSPDISPCDF